MKVARSVELEPWEEIFLREFHGWTHVQIAELKLGETDLVARVELLMLDKHLDSEEQAIRDAFMVGWIQCEKFHAEQARWESRANAH